MSGIIGYGVFLLLFYGYMARILKRTPTDRELWGEELE